MLSASDQVVPKAGDFKVDHLQVEEKYYSTAMGSGWDTGYEIRDGGYVMLTP